MKGFGTGATVTLLQPTWVLWPRPVGAGEGLGQPCPMALPFYKQVQKTLPKVLLIPKRPQNPAFYPQPGGTQECGRARCVQAAVTEHPGAENIYPPNGREGFG